MKMKMKNYGFSTLRVALLGVCAVGMVVPVLAQDGPPPPPAGQGQGYGHGGGQNQDRMLKRMTRELNLTPDQVSQIQAIQSDEGAKMQALNADGTDPGQNRHRQMKAIRDDETSRVRTVLTPDQQTKYDAMLAQRKEREQERRQEGAAPPPPPSL